MQGERASHHAGEIFDRRANWIIRTSGLAWREGGPGVAVSSLESPARGARILVRRGEICLALELELEAAIVGLQAAYLDAALSVAPQDVWGVELRTRSEPLIEMIATHDLWTDPAREGANRVFAALRPAFERMADLIGDIQDMGGAVAVARIGHSTQTTDDADFAAQARAELERHLIRRAVHVVRPLFALRGAGPLSARFFDIGVRAGLRAGPARVAALGPHARAFFDRGVACGAASRQA
ncbi:MAG: hypothetical protein ACJAVR_001656 [Paracoccaceae bacterium]|jgi:hypothetical protein